MRRWSRAASQSSATAAIARAPSAVSDVSTRTRLKSQNLGTAVACTSVPSAHGSTRSHTDACLAWRQAMASARGPEAKPPAPGSSGVVVLVAGAGAGAADHDLVLLDRDLDGGGAGPVLGVHRVVLHGRVEPQAVALLAVVERALQRAPGGALARAAAAGARAPLGLLLGLCVALGR